MGSLIDCFGQIRVDVELPKILTTKTLRYEALEYLRLMVEGERKVRIIC